MDCKSVPENCWEITGCGKEAGGARADLTGVCPAALPGVSHDGVNHGKHGGRFCWTVTGTLCADSVQGTYAEKLAACLGCPVLKAVIEEEERHFRLRP